MMILNSNQHYRIAKHLREIAETCEPQKRERCLRTLRCTLRSPKSNWNDRNYGRRALLRFCRNRLFLGRVNPSRRAQRM